MVHAVDNICVVCANSATYTCCRHHHVYRVDSMDLQQFAPFLRQMQAVQRQWPRQRDRKALAVGIFAAIAAYRIAWLVCMLFVRLWTRGAFGVMHSVHMRSDH